MFPKSVPVSRTYVLNLPRKLRGYKIKNFHLIEKLLSYVRISLNMHLGNSYLFHLLFPGSFNPLKDSAVARPDCFKCLYLEITWDPVRPYACRSLNFKSKLIPWREVFNSSGLPCQLFEPKPEKRKNPDKTER